MHNKKLSYLKDLPNSGENLLFADEDNPNLKLANAKLVRCLFVRLGLKCAIIRGTVFHQCVFEDCYFRKSKFYNVDFTGSFFKDCNLERASFEACKFWYIRFIRCQLNYDEILQSLPSEPNIAISLLKSLYQNAMQMGEKRIADKLLVKQIDIEKCDLKNRFLGITAYYKRRYKEIDRVISFLKWVGLTLSGWIWGHGLKIKNLLFSAILLIVTFAGLLFSFGNSDTVPMNFWDSIYLSSTTFATFGYIKHAPSSPSSLILCSVESFLGIVFLGFLASSVYRKFSR